ncbi:hypothetical protein SAMN04488490_0095 [Marinobacter sp. LV10R510-11A]|uniref:hypothetical protein n=1 Tax=Marinobacter sp. LV10R510-11A TaxID=1415568 RepID=UPI000BB9745E|nr:hypothetical protein [Marinobacter sp. LV10R510-11A]SOB74606.1 hypothetical protein SAMN04488490_0095 [Marinobacter sp. LV10R510-11A]
MEKDQKQDTPATLLPAEVIEDWNRRLQAAGCSEQHRSELKALIEHTLPHPSGTSIALCATAYTALCKNKPAVSPSKAVISSILAQLKRAGQLETSNRYVQSHPVAAAIKKMTDAASRLQVEPDRWLSFFLGLCQRARYHPERLSPGVYYQHTYYARDVTIFVLRSQTVLADYSVAEACSKLQTWFEHAEQTNEPLPIPIASVNNLDEKVSVLNRLLDETLTFGVPSVKRNQQETTDESSDKVRPSKRKSTPANPLPKEITDLKASPPREKIPRRQSLAYALGEANDDPPQLPTQPAQRSASAEPEARVDSEEIETVRIDAPPEFSPSERRKRYGNLLNVQAGQNALSRSDMQRFSRRQLSTWLEQFVEEEPLTACFLLLTWSLGMAPERLAVLRVGTGAPIENEDIVLNPITHRLTYRVLNLGATPDLQNTVGSTELPANHLMQLVLPAGLVELIASSGNEKPFQAQEKRYRELRKNIKKRFGANPCTLKQWAASAVSFQAERLNTLEAATLRGSTGFNEIASSAYRTHELAVLNAKFAECLVALRDYWDAEGLMTGPGTEAFADLAVIGVCPEGTLGSIRYASPEALAPVVYAIRNAIKQTHQRLNTPYKTKPVRDLLALINLQQLNYFLALQLHTLGRALNNKTTIGFSPEGLWVSDKASHRYRERKLICAISPEDMKKQRGLLLTQREQCRDALDQLTELARTLGLDVQLAEPAVADLPCFVELSRSKKVVKIVRLTPGRWQRAIDELGLGEVWTMAGNVFRHLASTELSASLSDAVVDEVLGHKHPGRDWWGSESAGSFTQLTVMTPIIEDWAQRMGLRVVTLDERVFGGFYDLS